jgi:AmmeMemoRadiSam system protein A
MTMPDELDASERSTLLSLARAAIHDRLQNDGTLDRTLDRAEISGRLRAKRCSFVTIRNRGAGGAKGALRGCIGSMTSSDPLFRDVIRNAVNAAFHDPRFSPVHTDELPGLSLEISALTPLRPVSGPGQIVVGRDGVELQNGPHRAVFLPQVAPEQGWDLKEMLENLSVKAGLDRDGWMEAGFRVFQAEVFGETEPPGKQRG